MMTVSDWRIGESGALNRMIAATKPLVRFQRRVLFGQRAQPECTGDGPRRKRRQRVEFSFPLFSTTP
jgi:hypothetical protein